VAPPAAVGAGIRRLVREEPAAQGTAGALASLAPQGCGVWESHDPEQEIDLKQ
jgi:hypothetical protein